MIPIAMVVSYSFQDNVIVEKNPVFAGLANYTEGAHRPRVPDSDQEHLPLHHPQHHRPPRPGAGLCDDAQHRFVGWIDQAIFRIVYILPWLFTIAVVAVIWRLMLDPFGVVNYILTTLGILQTEVNWLADPSTALWALTFINIWSGYPFFMISLLAGLQGISSDLYEAAAVDGANPIQQFFNITIPQLKPVLISMAVLDLIWTSQQFALIWLTTGGGP